MKPCSFAYESMGTSWNISIWDRLSSVEFETVRKKIISLSQDFDQTYSRFIPSSFVSQLATKTGVVTVPAHWVPMLRIYMKLYSLSGKKFTPLIGKTLADMGYDQTYSLKPKKQIRTVPDLNTTVQIIDDTHIKIHEPVLFDFGALGKGYAVELIQAYLQTQGVKRFLVNGSGDIAYVGNGAPITVGLEHPLDTSKVIGSIEMRDGAMCSSGANRRVWNTYHHIIDPQLLSSPTDIVATWVIADSATIADALATALFLCPPEAFSPAFPFEYCILNRQMRVKRSAGFSATLY
ncbi:MAG: FAD:protein FMN transferase [Candidatus Roizmanbacteria bacterium]|nr:FAD:protein FMN transferase [Candidatus Roizmanbacteria bacterium]